VSRASIGKRSFRYDAEFDHTFCPIVKATIGKILCVAISGGPLTDDQRSIASLDSSMFEFAQYGRESYDIDMKRLAVVLEDAGLTYKLPSFDTTVRRQLQGVKPWEPVVEAVKELKDLNAA
jgi:hypothetical protein